MALTYTKQRILSCGENLAQDIDSSLLGASMANTHKTVLSAEIVTNLNITSYELREALEKLVYSHSDYDKDKTVAYFPLVKVEHRSS